MTVLATARRRVGRGARLSNAFILMDLREEFNYPLSFGMAAIASLVPVVTFYFIATFVGPQGNTVAGDYYTFVILGLIGMTVLSSGLQALSKRLAATINLGRLEMLLSEPIPWSVLPFLIVQWQVVVAALTALLIFGASLLLGAHFNWAGIIPGMAVLVLGLAATLSIGVVNASLKVLSKRADPILALYGLAASILSGTYYSVEVLPAWLKPVAWLIPHTYVLQALRRVLMPSGADMPGPSALSACFILAGFSVMLFPIGLWLYGKAFEYGRRTGLLSGY